MHGVLCSVHGVLCSVHGVLCSVHGVLCSVHGVHGVLCCPVDAVHYGVQFTASAAKLFISMLVNTVQSHSRPNPGKQGTGAAGPAVEERGMEPRHWGWNPIPLLRLPDGASL